MKTFITFTTMRNGHVFASVQNAETKGEVIAELEEQDRKDGKVGRTYDAVQIENPENFLLWAKIKIAK